MHAADHYYFDYYPTYVFKPSKKGVTCSVLTTTTITTKVSVSACFDKRWLVRGDLPCE